MRMKTQIVKDADMMAMEAADKIQALIDRNNACDKPTVLGLATGSTPKPLYAELRRRHEEEGLDFSRVITFNLDEYVGVPHDDEASYYHYMHEQLFDYVNIDEDNIHMLDGMVSKENMAAHCANYEQAIHDAGGIDLQILGIGGEGHIGFNEAVEKGEPFDIRSRTRLVKLSDRTVSDNNAPSTHALSMGVGTIMEAKELLLLASGGKKAGIIQKTLEGNALDVGEVPARIIRSHKNASVLIDDAAASWLPRNFGRER